MASLSSTKLLPHFEIFIGSPRLIEYKFDNVVNKFRFNSSPYGFYVTDNSANLFFSISQNEFVEHTNVKYLIFTDTMEELLSAIWKYIAVKEKEYKSLQRPS